MLVLKYNWWNVFRSGDTFPNRSDSESRRAEFHFDEAKPYNVACKKNKTKHNKNKRKK